MKGLAVYLLPAGWDAIIVPDQTFTDNELLDGSCFHEPLVPFHSNYVSHILRDVN